MEKISGPLLDRIDIQIEVGNVKFESLKSCKKAEPSEVIQKRVEQARKIQLQRYEKDGIYSNSELTQDLIEKYCKLNEDCNLILEKAFKKMGFSARVYCKILKVARTIADMDNSKNIESRHLLEAIKYRNLDKNHIYEKGKGLAIAGLVVGIVDVVWYFIALFIKISLL